jgi:hypothetical protein
MKRVAPALEADAPANMASPPLSRTRRQMRARQIQKIRLSNRGIAR